MSNPVLSEKQWGEISDREGGMGVAEAMTVNGTVTKTGLLLVVMLATMGWLFSQYWNGGAPLMASVMPFVIGGAIAGLVLCVLMMFAKRMAMLFGLGYAVAEGLFLGGVTMAAEVRFPGLPLLAASFTVATLLGMLLLYRSGVIKASNGFVKGVIGATCGLALGVLLLGVLSYFGIGTGIRGALYGNGPIGIGFSVVCIGLAALNLVIDFRIIEDGARERAPKYMEWVGAFGLLVTLVWLYIEILNLLAKLRSND
jgi:uncharacterized YccA/Bax inhibitor family protein